jgi:tetratricopeptide (TPR) repeat protein
VRSIVSADPVTFLSVRVAASLLAVGMTACSAPPSQDPAPAPSSAQGQATATAQQTIPAQQTTPAQNTATAHDTAPSVPAGELEAIRAMLDAGKPRDALAALDRYTREHPADARGWVLFGEACLAASHDDARPDFYWLDAADAFERAGKAGAGPQAWIRASRAARRAGQAERAVEDARRAAEAFAAPDAEIERVLIEALFDACLAARDDAPRRISVCIEWLQLLMVRQVRMPDDAWAKSTFARFHEAHGELAGALAPLGELVELAPSDESTHARLVTALRATHGSKGVLQYYEAFAARHPDLALADWYPAQERLEEAVREYLGGEDSSAWFADAEDRFARCRTRAPEYADACKKYEVLCRAGVGWCRLAAGDLDGAERAFLSMEDVFPGGAQWQLEGRLESGVKGLQLVADRHLRVTDDPGEYEDAGTLKAAAIFRRLHEIVPADAALANNCAFFHRETGNVHIARAFDLAAKAKSATDAADRADLERRSARELEEARRALAISRDAYFDAAKLAPDDARIVNDTGLLLAYYYPSRVDEAEALLLRAAELASAQLGAAGKDGPALDAQARDALLEVLGDAHQNLGTLNLLIRKKPDVARAHYQKSFEIGPRPRIDREWIRAHALPACDRAAAGEAIDASILDDRFWSAE